MKFRPLFLFALVVLIISISGCKPNPAALMTAVKADNTEEARKLIEKGADPNSRTSPTGWSALHYAARNGNVEIVSLLLKAGADPNYSGTMEGQTGTVVSLQPLLLAQATLDLVKQIPVADMQETLHQIGLDDPALLKSMKDPDAAVRYQKVVDALTPVTTKK
ncbi:MAG: ankyrin repeat domain-containing protein [Terracidiphilus sp.]|jgi:ankyrin repeat protein